MSALIDDELLRPSGWYDEQDRLTATFRNAPETITAHEAGHAVAYLLHSSTRFVEQVAEDVLEPHWPVVDRRPLTLWSPRPWRSP